MKRFLLFLSVLTAVVLLISCSGKKQENPDVIKVGVQSGPEYTVALKAKEVAKDQFGLEVELVVFNDYIMPNTALHQGDIDVNAFQHEPFLKEQMQKRGYKFVPVGKTFVYPLAAYSRKIRSLDELANGSTVVIPNDITNGGRALLLLQKAGLITLKGLATVTPNVTDIADNPKQLTILELEAPQLPRVLDDSKVALAVINNTFATQAGLYLSEALFVEDKDSPYVNVIVAREDNKEAGKVQKFVRAFQSEAVAKEAEKEFKGGAIQGW